MKIPNNIRIGGVDYAISFEECLVSGNKVLDAEIDYCKATIKIVHPERGHQHKCIGLWHEVLHGIANHANFDIGENTEDVIEVLSRGIYQVLQDNGDNLFDLVQSEVKK